MRRAAAAGFLTCVLAAYAQAPPETPPPNEAQPAAAPSQDQPQGPQPAAGETAPAEAAGGRAAKAAPTPPAARPSAPQASQPKPPAAVREESAGEAGVAALRREVNRLQSELDAERAAAASARVEDAAPGHRSARGVWGWFVATALLALGAGFVLGWRLLDRRIRRQYGGLRIY